MTEKRLAKGDRVSWSTHGRTVRASADDPQYLVKSEKSGREAVHKPESLQKTPKKS